METKGKILCVAAILGLVATGALIGASPIKSIVAQANAPTLSYRGVGSCAAHNYGVNIYDPNFIGHIDFTTGSRESVGTEVSIKNGAALKFGKSGTGGTYDLDLGGNYCAAYIWAAGWNGKTPTMTVNDGEPQTIAANTLVAGNPDCDIYYDRYAVNFDSNDTLTITTNERIAVGGIAVYTTPFTNEELAPLYIEADGPETPTESSSSSIPAESSSSEQSSSSSPAASSSEVPVGAITILPSDGPATESSDFTITKNGITINVKASTLTSEQIRVFKGKTITISAESLSKIEFTCTVNGEAKYGPGCLTTDSGYTFETSGKKGTWIGNATSVTFTAATNQSRITQIVVTK